MACVEESETKYPYLIEVVGKSGYGKTAFVDHCLKLLKEEDPSWLIAKGRCFHQENVPYPGFDELFDNLAMQLSKSDEAEVCKVLPRNLESLTGMFPVIGGVPAVRKALDESNRSHDHNSRKGATDGLEELVARIGHFKRLVWAIDDFQFANLESNKLLRLILDSRLSPKIIICLFIHI